MSNLQPFDRLTRPQHIALISILSGDEPSRTASLAGVTARCIRNWRKLPVFQEALAEARRDFFSACRSHLNASLAVAFETVLRTSSASWNDSDRLKASLFLLDRIGQSGISALAAIRKYVNTNAINNLDKKPCGTNRNPTEIRGAQRKSPAPRWNLPEPAGTRSRQVAWARRVR